MSVQGILRQDHTVHSKPCYNILIKQSELVSKRKHQATNHATKTHSMGCYSKKNIEVNKTQQDFCLRQNWACGKSVRQKGLPLTPYEVQWPRKDREDCVQMPNLKMQISGKKLQGHRMKCRDRNRSVLSSPCPFSSAVISLTWFSFSLSQTVWKFSLGSSLLSLLFPDFLVFLFFLPNFCSRHSL